MSTHTIPNDIDPNSPIIIVTLSNVIKLNPQNYLSWKLQIEAILDGYGLFKFLDGSFPAPPSTIVKDTVSTSNPACQTWSRQDSLLYGALVGTLDQNVVPLISLTTTTQQLWGTLAQTFASSSRGHIKQLKAKFKNITKGPQTITEFMHAIKACTDHLALLGAPIQQEYITDRVLEGLDDSYQGVIDAVNARDSPISFAELHEKLINRELTIKNQPLLGVMPATANPTTSRSAPSYPHRQSHHTPTSYHRTNYSFPSTNKSHPSFTGTRPFLGKCQWCHTKGHSLQKCPIFLEKYPNIRPPPPLLTRPTLPKPMLLLLPPLILLHNGF